MQSRLADRLRAARRRWFVGREAERTLFREALAAEDLPFCLLYVHGPGGVGKSSLLAEFARIAEEQGASAAQVDARNVEALPESFTQAVRRAVGGGADEHPLDTLAARPGRHVLLIDTFETLAPLDGWLRDVFLPQLPEGALVVLAGRQALGSAWRADPGWQVLARSLPLRNLTPAESRHFLQQQDIPAGHHAAVLDFTHGHPLALSLVAEVAAQQGDAAFQPESAPDVVRALLERFIDQAPDPSQRLALEACATVRLMTEPLLAAMLDVPGDRAADVFGWLRGLSFIESAPGGVFPHDLAREALLADLRWRNAARYALLHDRSRDYYLARLGTAGESEQPSVLADYIFLHRDNPVVRPFLEWAETGGVLSDSLRDVDMPLLLSMVELHEGSESAELAAHWVERQPEGVVVFRDAEQQPAGFMSTVALERATAEEISVDPGALAVSRFLERAAPLRPGERATLFRFWMAREGYQAVSSVQSMTFILAVRHYLTTPDLACSFFACSEPDFWAPVFAYADLHRVPDVDFEVGGRGFGVYWHDWRVTPPMAWLQLLAEREIATAQAVPPPAPVAPLLVLSREAFTTAVRDALRDFHRPAALAQNPLLRSRVVTSRAESDTDQTRIAALRALLEQAVASLETHPRDAKLARALDRTYFRPAETQERAAELLDLPFSTYRRHLSSGIARLTEALWPDEIQ